MKMKLNMNMISEQGLPNPNGGPASRGGDMGDGVDSVSSEDSFGDGIDDTTTHDKGSNNNSSETDEDMKFLNLENTRVRSWRIIVLLVLLGTGAVVTAGTFLFLQHTEIENYLEGYSLYTSTISDVSRKNFKNFEITMKGMADQVTAASSEQTNSFPLVRIPHFEVRAYAAREHAGVDILAWAPVVLAKHRAKWDQFISEESSGPEGWLNESRQFHQSFEDVAGGSSPTDNETANATLRGIWSYNADGNYQEEPDLPLGPYVPIWQVSPPPPTNDFINYELLSEYSVARMFLWVKKHRVGLFGELSDTLANLAAVELMDEAGQQRPHSLHMEPIFSTFYDGASLAAILVSVVPWDNYLDYAVPEGVNGITAVLKNSCGEVHTYILRGTKASYVGPGDMHDPAYDNTEAIVPLTNDISHSSIFCMYSFYLYSSTEYKDSDTTSVPAICACLVAGIFFVVACTFFIYDLRVSRRNSLVVDAATRSNKIVSSLFPTQFRHQLFKENDAKAQISKSGGRNLKSMMKSGEYLSATHGAKDGVTDDDDFMYQSKPIADLFPCTTILFADIVGFTAWSSVREPSQVFVLLETLYHAFDTLAKKRRVFKVETIGDCYVAVTGLPEPRKDHALAMCRFSRECLFKMRILTKRLEVSLGPETADLGMRMGIHSGPVTAGVLRGERARFQLFGDTMNTAARMEHTSVRDRIQLSQETMDLLIAVGKSGWASPRKDIVTPKGKGEMKTYWLGLSSSGSDVMSRTIKSSCSSSGSVNIKGVQDPLTESHGCETKTKRLVEWNTDVLLRLLKQIVARRQACPPQRSETTLPNEARFSSVKAETQILDEVLEIIKLPRFRKAAVLKQVDAESIQLDPKVEQQLHNYVGRIAACYRDNPFHNFEHASHVTMSVVKLLSRIVAPQDFDVAENADSAKLASSLHDHTYGITSDPLTQFACVFSALIHDADHFGVTNTQLVKEGADVARRYKNRSVAEQRSVDLSWDLLMENDYSLLRSTIYKTDAELKRFRQLIVNAVMATDIVDKDLKKIRNSRWDRAFSVNKQDEDVDARVTISRKATIVIEHLIQASDVSHTMQHWHVYIKWNEKFFTECYQGYLDGRAETNPVDHWYKGELGFFDFYIIPLAKKLKNCGVFGVSSDEYLNYAISNRKEWELRGQEVLMGFIERSKRRRIDHDATKGSNNNSFSLPGHSLQLAGEPMEKLAEC